MVANGEHEGQRHPTQGDTLCEPHRLGGVGEFTKEHVHHREDVGGQSHDEEPGAGLQLLIASLCYRDEDVDQHGNQEHAHHQGLEAQQHGSNGVLGRVNIEEAKDERKEVGEHHDAGEQHGDHGGVGFTGQAAVAVSGGCDHGAADQSVQQGNAQEVHGGFSKG